MLEVSIFQLLSGYLKHFRSNWPTMRFWGPVCIGLVQTVRRLFALIGGLLRGLLSTPLRSVYASILLARSADLTHAAQARSPSVLLRGLPRTHGNSSLQSFEHDPDLSLWYVSCHSRVNTKAIGLS